MPPTTTASARRCGASAARRWAGAAVACLVVLLVATVPAAGASVAGPAQDEAQDEAPPADQGPGLDPGEATDDGTGAARDGPDPTGRPVPPTGQRVVDTAIWIALVAVLASAAVLVGRAWWRAGPASPPLVPLDRTAPEEERAGGAPAGGPAEGDGGARDHR